MTTVATLKADVPFLIRLGTEIGEDGLERTLSQPGAPADLVASFRRLAERHGGVAEFTRQTLGTLDHVLSSKQEAVRAESERMQSGGARGVISGGADPEACALGLAVMLLSAPVSPAASLAGGLLAVLSC